MILSKQEIRILRACSIKPKSWKKILRDAKYSSYLVLENGKKVRKWDLSAIGQLLLKNYIVGDENKIKYSLTEDGISIKNEIIVHPPLPTVEKTFIRNVGGQKFKKRRNRNVS